MRIQKVVLWSFGRLISLSLSYINQDNLLLAKLHGLAPLLYTIQLFILQTSVRKEMILVDLINIQANLLNGVSPWIMGGNFNETIHPAEHSAPHTNQIPAPMRDFKACVDKLEIRDLIFHGPLFTWTNKQPDDPIAKTLNKALINEQWINAYPLSLAKFLAPEISNHSPC